MSRLYPSIWTSRLTKNTQQPSVRTLSRRVCGAKTKSLHRAATRLTQLVAYCGSPNQNSRCVKTHQKLVEAYCSVREPRLKRKDAQSRYCDHQSLSLLREVYSARLPGSPVGPFSNQKPLTSAALHLHPVIVRAGHRHQTNNVRRCNVQVSSTARTSRDT